MAYSAQSFYRPGVLPDTQGMGPGIQGAASAIAGALGTYAGWKRDDVVRADQQQFATGRDEARMAHESGMIDKRMARDVEMFGMEQDAQKQQREIEKAMADEQLRAANAGKAAFLMQSGYDPTAVQAASKMSPKAAAEFLDAGMSQAGLELRKRMEMEEYVAKAAEARKVYKLTDPLTGMPETSAFMTGNGQQVARGAARPREMTPEQIKAFGLDPKSATVGGVRFEAPDKTQRDPKLVQGVDGNWYRFDGPTGKMILVPMEGQPAGPQADPSNAIKSILSSRQK